MAQDKKSLSRLTLRQLRIKASDLRIPLYSRKTKASLIREISLYQEREETEAKLLSLSGLNNLTEKISNSFSSSNLSTRVVFLPRDPEWAYVFWEICDENIPCNACLCAKRPHIFFLRIY